jgi:hypothetical protein
MKVKHAHMMHEALTVWNSGRWRFIPEPEYSAAERTENPALSFSLR